MLHFFDKITIFWIKRVYSFALYQLVKTFEALLEIYLLKKERSISLGNWAFAKCLKIVPVYRKY